MSIRRDDLGGAVRRLTLARPPANALDEVLLSDLNRELQAARGDDRVRSILIAGEGRFFCGGFDLAASRRDADSARRLRELYRDVHVALLGLPKPTVALLQGHAIAGGLVLALACDFIVAAAGSYRIGLNEVAIGASFPKIAFEIVRLRLPHGSASQLLLGAGLHSAMDGPRLGLCEEIVAPEAAERLALEKAARLGSFPREAYAHTKAALVAEAIAAVRNESAEEAESAAAVWTTPESRAARARQRDKLHIRSGG